MRLQRTKGVAGRVWARGVGVAACAAAVGLVAPAAAAAAGRQLLAPVGGGYGQTVRMTVAAPEREACTLSAGLLLPAQPVPIAARELDLAPGQTGVLDVSLTRLVGRPGRRVELLPYTELRRGACLVSTEVFEQVTGRTMAISKGSIVGFDPQPDPPADAPVAAALPALGVASGQILRLGVARGFDPQPEPPGDAFRCVAVLAFADARGAIVGGTLAVDLGEGAAATLDLNPALLLPASPGALPRMVAQPRLLLPASGGGDTRGCVASVQIVDAVTAWTTAYVSGH